MLSLLDNGIVVSSTILTPQTFVPMLSASTVFAFLQQSLVDATAKTFFVKGTKDAVEQKSWDLHAGVLELCHKLLSTGLILLLILSQPFAHA